MARPIPMIDRFWRSVDKNGPPPSHRPDLGQCWLWTGRPHANGRGLIRETPTKKIWVHRYSWVVNRGTIPDGMLVLHHCDVPLCVRPDHLYLGTQADNGRDMSVRERAGLMKVGREMAGQIRDLYDRGNVTHRDIAVQLHVSQTTVWRILTGQRYRDYDH